MMKYNKVRSYSRIEFRGYFDGTDVLTADSSKYTYDCHIADSYIEHNGYYFDQEVCKENRKRKLRDDWKWNFLNRYRVKPWVVE